jgi:hypothetical protein
MDRKQIIDIQLDYSLGINTSEGMVVPVDKPMFLEIFMENGKLYLMLRHCKPKPAEIMEIKMYKPSYPYPLDKCKKIRKVGR